MTIPQGTSKGRSPKMYVYGELKKADLENLSADVTPGVIGRIYWNTATVKAMLDDGTNVRAFLRNDANAVFGSNGTANSNIRFHRGAAAVLQFVLGGDATAEGTLSTSLAQLSFKFEGYATGSLPAAANAGRIAWDTTTVTPKFDTGAAWINLSPTTTRGDIYVRGASDNSRLAIGAANTVLFSNATDPAWGQIVDAYISASAAIARSKIATGTNYRILANSSAGVMSENAALTATHVIYADANGQLAGEAALSISRGGTGQATKAPAFDALSPMTTSGDIIYGGASGTGTRLPKGSDGQYLTLVSGLPAWGTVAAADITKLRNRLLNSAFANWQHSTSVTIANAASTYAADRWYVKNSLGTNGVITYSRQTASVDGSAYAAKVLITTAPTAAQTNGTELYQTLENLDSLKLYNQTASFSIQVKAFGNVNQIGVQFFYKTTEAKVDTAIGSEQTFSVTTGAYATASISGQALGTSQTTSGVIGVRIRITGVSTGNAYDLNNGFQVEQGILNIGTTPTTWGPAYPSTAMELAACQRFALRLSSDSTFSQIGFGWAVSTTIATTICPFPQTMRTKPTMTQSASSDFQVSDGTTAYAVTSLAMTATQSSSYQASVEGTVASGLTQFRPFRIECANKSAGVAWVLFYAEI